MEHSLSAVTGAAVDLESPIGPLQIIKNAKRVAELDVTKLAARRLPEIMFYEHINFGGRSERTNLNYSYVGSWWNDKISSIVSLLEFGSSSNTGIFMGASEDTETRRLSQYTGKFQFKYLVQGDQHASKEKQHLANN